LGLMPVLGPLLASWASYLPVRPHAAPWFPLRQLTSLLGIMLTPWLPLGPHTNLLGLMPVSWILYPPLRPSTSLPASCISARPLVHIPASRAFCQSHQLVPVIRAPFKYSVSELIPRFLDFYILKCPDSWYIGLPDSGIPAVLMNEKIKERI
jgi:hypothetical protein